MKLKICGLREESNIRRILRLKPDYIGFIFYQGSPRGIQKNASFAAFVRSVSDTQKVGVFVDEKYEIIVERILDYGLDQIQLHGRESAEFCKALNRIKPVIKAFAVDEQFDFSRLNAYVGCCTYFLFDTPTVLHGGSGRSFNWKLLEQQAIPLPFFLSGGIGPEDAIRVKEIRHPAFLAADINSRFEISAGVKNMNLLKQFTHELFY